MGIFGENLKNIRETQGITQQELANVLDLTRPTISGYETKGKEPDYETLVQIADVLGVTVDTLLRKMEPGSKKEEKVKTKIPEEFKTHLCDISEIRSDCVKMVSACNDAFVKACTSKEERFREYVAKMVKSALLLDEGVKKIGITKTVGKMSYYEEIEDLYKKKKKNYKEKASRLRLARNRHYSEDEYDWETEIINKIVEIVAAKFARNEVSCLEEYLLLAKEYGYTPDTEEETNGNEQKENALGERIFALLKMHGVSQRELAAKTGISEVSISTFVNGKAIPTSEELIKIADSLKTSTGYLLGII